MSINHAGQERTREIQPENIPDELRGLKQWVNWAGIWSEDKENFSKPPMTSGGRNASSTKPGTWTTLEKSLAALGRDAIYTDSAGQKHSVTLDGVGLAGLERTGWSGIDLDHCVNPVSGEINAAARKIVEHFDSYTEITPSGEGLRIWIEAEKPPTWSANKTGETDIEVYDKGRFFTVTGRHLEGTPWTVEKRQEALDAFMAQHAPECPKTERRPYTGPEGYVFDLEGLLGKSGVAVLSQARDETSKTAYRIVCPWAHEHTGHDTSGTRVGQYDSGAPWFQCDHGHCDGRRWEQFREELDPEAYRKVELRVGGKKLSDNPANSANSYMRTDLGNAERFVDAYRDRVRWCPARKSWLVWGGQRYAWDDRGESVKLAHYRARAIFHEAAYEEDESKQKAISKWAVASQSESRINAMLSQAKPYLAVGMDELDRDPWLINCQNGTLDLKTGRLKEHDPADLITRIVPVSYDPGAACPRFERFLRETLVDAEVVGFVKRYAGYTLTGATRERILTILYGSGKNGKTTLVELLHEAMGDYARNTDVETLLIRKYSGVGNDVAALKGARFVSAAEVEKGRRLAESKVKQLTGRDTVTARFLFGENFDFKPEFKLWLSTNNKPVIQGTDDAIWDRLRLIPFTQRFDGDKADPLLSDKLRAELAGVFAWMVEGCLQWQEHGLGEPESVTEATRQYRSEMDTLAAFFEDRCVIREGVMTPASLLYKQYQMWCDDAGENAETQKMFGMRLSERGFVSEKIKHGEHKDRKGWFGIGLRAGHPDPEDPDSDDDEPPEGAESG